MNKLALLLAFCPAVDAWGRDGHSITSRIAMNLLSSDETAWVKKVMGQDLADVASWADNVKYSADYRYSGPLHFINVVDGQCQFDWDRDCKDEKGTPGICVGNAILNYTDRMLHPPSDALSFTGCKGLHKADCVAKKACEWDYKTNWRTACKDRDGPGPSPGPSPSPHPSPSPGPSPGPSPYGPLSVQDEALRFLSHFMGDIHQPLHVSWTTDRGGNDIHVEEGFDGDFKMNLHAVWDEGIITKEEKDSGVDWNGLAKQLTDDVVSGKYADQKASWSKCLDSSSPDLKACVTEMAEESIGHACKDAYTDDKGDKITNKEDLDDDYYKTRAEVINERLAAGGVRLAALTKYLYKSINGLEQTIVV